MPVPPLSNSFEGGADGIGVTAGNSGGDSGIAFSDVQVGATSAVTYSITQARDVLSGSIAHTTYSESYFRWDGLGSLTGAVNIRMYLWFAALPAANQRIAHWITNAGAVCAALRMTTAGFLVGLNAAGGAISGNTGTVAAATGQWIRVEARVAPSTTVGSFDWRLFNDPDSTTATDSASSAATQVLGANVDRLYFGHIGGTGVGAVTWYFDNLAVSDVGWIGTGPPPPPPSSSPRRGTGFVGFG